MTLLQGTAEGGSGPSSSAGRHSDQLLSAEELQAQRTALNQDKNRKAQRRFRARQKEKLSDAELQLNQCRKMLGREQDARRKTETENQFLMQVQGPLWSGVGPVGLACPSRGGLASDNAGLQRMAALDQQLRAWRSAAAASALSGQPISPVSGVGPGALPGPQEGVVLSLQPSTPIFLSSEEVGATVISWMRWLVCVRLSISAVIWPARHSAAQMLSCMHVGSRQVTHAAQAPGLRLAQHHAACQALNATPSSCTQVAKMQPERLASIWRQYVAYIKEALSLARTAQEAGQGMQQANERVELLANEACILLMRVSLCNPACSRVRPPHP